MSFRSNECNSLAPEVLKRLALNARMIQKIEQSGRVQESVRIPPYMSPQQFYREQRQRYALPPQRIIKTDGPLVQARASTLPPEAAESLYRNARIIAHATREASPFLHGGNARNPTAIGHRLPPSAWDDEEEEETHLRVMKYPDPVRSQSEDELEDENEQLAWHAVRDAQRLVRRRFGA